MDKPEPLKYEIDQEDNKKWNVNNPLREVKRIEMAQFCVWL